jgi:hypothetical protein
MTEYDDLLNMLNRAPARSMQSRLPREVKRKIADKLEWSRQLGLCLYCRDVLIANQDRILRSSEIQTFGGTFSEKCHLNATGHELDPRFTWWSGRDYLAKGRDDVRESNEPPY